MKIQTKQNRYATEQLEIFINDKLSLIKNCIEIKAMSSIKQKIK